MGADMAMLLTASATDLLVDNAEMGTVIHLISDQIQLIVEVHAFTLILFLPLVALKAIALRMARQLANLLVLPGLPMRPGAFPLFPFFRLLGVAHSRDLLALCRSRSMCHSERFSLIIRQICPCFSRLGTPSTVSSMAAASAAILG